MQIASLRIENFRGIQQGTINFSRHTVLVGPNNSGKSTIIEALALLFGRERMVRSLTEHDFYGSSPQPADRIRLIATVVGFDGDDPTQHLEWFRDGRGIVKWWDPVEKAVRPLRDQQGWSLACQIAFSARFSREDLEVETKRYFYDDDGVGDVFAGDEVATSIPAQIIRSMGFFLVPASRTWDRTISFGSELFRKVVAAAAGQPYASVLAERDRLRQPLNKLEDDEHLAPIVTSLNDELRGFFRTAPSVHLRVTTTDSDGLLEAVAPHYAHEGAALAIPARRHGSGLLSLQHLLLLLQFGRLRDESGEGFWMALEEPELHVPPPLQRRLVHRVQALSTQTIVTTHSPTVAALADPQGVLMVRAEGGMLTSQPLLASVLAADTPNSVRKLFQVNRVETIAALMHDFVLVPEGRTDFEWLGLLVRAVDLHQGWTAEQTSWFDAFVGVVPTHDGAVVRSVAALAPLHRRVVALVDGDAEGMGYSNQLIAANTPNLAHILRWPGGQMLEDVIGWIVAADVTILAAMALPQPPANVAELVARLRSEDRPAGGMKKDTTSYEAIASAIGLSDACRARARTVLDALSDAVQGKANAHVVADANQPMVKVFAP